MNTILLNFVKNILEKVSFEPRLFEKELRKAIKELTWKEIKSLRKWCYENFGSLYRETLNRVFLRRTKLKYLVL
jgi:hypothetical protein